MIPTRRAGSRIRLPANPSQYLTLHRSKRVAYVSRYENASLVARDYTERDDSVRAFVCIRVRTATATFQYPTRASNRLVHVNWIKFTRR